MRLPCGKVANRHNMITLINSCPSINGQFAYFWMDANSTFGIHKPAASADGLCHLISLFYRNSKVELDNLITFNPAKGLSP
jgi:hypothetical protein